ncbi:glucose 1-dehydrogenase [Microbacterium horticulturae]|uniref:Glucose 1-dehydrogenase n=1 Tax=Microbacterium horticulturae TaxID=3028316 RepID=A0ABY8BUK5_9MICO|nr:glucose 1-dehydrogenase [Microbacterium sp. KACC 23027]WEG07565.1 glucose 1-dehydrogenase [Microbacterium sp. KACC 23027]
MKLDGKVALVTGAAKGIGKAIAELYAEEGAKVFLADVLEAELEATGEGIVRAGGVAEWMRADVARLADVEAMIAAAVDAFGTLDILVNNAGVVDNYEPAHQVSEKQWNRIYDVNIHGVLRAMRSAVPIFLEKGSGNIINISSISGLVGGVGGAAYVSSKWAVVGLTKNSAHMYNGTGIRVNAICPGMVDTDILKTMHEYTDWPVVQEMLKTVSDLPMGRPEDIAALALYLASDSSSFMNGSIVTADGGMTAMS